MTIGGVLTAIVFGVVVGALGRLVVPGRQTMSIWLMILVGIIAATIGAWLGQEIFDWGEETFNFPVALLQILLAAIGVFAVTSLWPKRGGV
jgi:uncharacterized membrane protein YeaQ/YmgE (transglycosylase-associated protein family)